MKKLYLYLGDLLLKIFNELKFLCYKTLTEENIDKIIKRLEEKMDDYEAIEEESISELKKIEEEERNEKHNWHPE